MPRTTNQIRYKVSLPEETFARLAQVAQEDATPLAEVIRRLCDLATTFDFPPRSIPITEDTSHPHPFVFYIPEPMLDATLQVATTRELDLDGLLSAVATVYLAKRARTQRDRAA